MNERAGDGGREIKPLDGSAYCLGLRLLANWKRLLWLDFRGWALLRARLVYTRVASCHHC